MKLHLPDIFQTHVRVVIWRNGRRSGISRTPGAAAAIAVAEASRGAHVLISIDRNHQVMVSNNGIAWLVQLPLFGSRREPPIAKRLRRALHQATSTPSTPTKELTS